MRYNGDFSFLNKTDTDISLWVSEIYCFKMTRTKAPVKGASPAVFFI
jgi:hypothetical protein